MKVVHMKNNAFWKGESNVGALVREQGKVYRVNLYFKQDRLYEYSCSCEEGSFSPNLCIHAKALEEAWRKKLKEEGPPIRTSAPAKDMLREYAKREKARILGEGETGIRLTVCALLNRREMRLEFKVGREKLYVVKDLAAFVKAVETGAYLEYGKNRGFFHSRFLFDEESQPLLDFVLETVGAYCEYHEQFGKGGIGLAFRFLTVSRANTDRFFGMMKGKYLDINDYKLGDRRTLVVQANPNLNVTIRSMEKQGVTVSVDPALRVLKGERYLYVADKSCIYCCDRPCSESLEVFLEHLTREYDVRGEAQISTKDMPLFYRQVLNRIGPYCFVDSGDLDLQKYKPEELKAAFYLDSKSPEEIVLKPVLSYGEHSFQPVEEAEPEGIPYRDEGGELRVSQVILRYFKHKEAGSGYPLLRGDEEGMYRLLTEGIREFMALGQVYLSEGAGALKVLPPPKAKVRVESRGGEYGGWLELQVDMSGLSTEDLSRILSEYRMKKKYYRLKSGEFLRLEDSGLITVTNLLENLSISPEELEQGTVSLPAYRAAYLDGVLKEDGSVVFYRDQFFKALVRGMKSVEDSDFEVPPALASILREYQKTGYLWLKTLSSYGFGGILADDMGLGKTLQMIALLLDGAGKEEPRTSLIICPASLVFNWENELLTFAPSLKVLTVAGGVLEREEFLSGGWEGDVLITSYDLLKRDMTLYEGRKFRFLVLDEAQYIKNPSTLSAKAVKSICAKNRFALTGTPIENRLSELWSIFDFLMPGFLFSYRKFKKNYETPIVREQDSLASERLHRLIAPFVLRRLKKDVLKELPDKLETVVYSVFDQEQRSLYTAHAHKFKQDLSRLKPEQKRNAIKILAQLSRLRQICCDPHLCYEDYNGQSAKLETCMDLVRDGVDGGHKILLFSQFTSMLEIIEGRLRAEGIPFYKLTGETSKEQRLLLVNEFQRNEVPVFLISLKAGGTGLNLTAADLVIHYDPWWNQAVQSQAEDRAHRIGQTREVTVYKLIAKGTIEENILYLQRTKKDLADQIIAEEGFSPGKLSPEDLLGLLEEREEGKL